MSPDSYKSNLKPHLFNASFWLSYSLSIFILSIVLISSSFLLMRLEHSTEWIWRFINHMNYYVGSKTNCKMGLENRTFTPCVKLAICRVDCRHATMIVEWWIWPKKWSWSWSSRVLGNHQKTPSGPSSNCCDIWHIVMQYCPMANYHYVH